MNEQRQNIEDFLFTEEWETRPLEKEGIKKCNYCGNYAKSIQVYKNGKIYTFCEGCWKDIRSLKGHQKQLFWSKIENA